MSESLLGKFVVVTTRHRGVFAGYLEDHDGETSVTLRDAQNVLYWSAETRGFLGLAATGPKEGSRIGPAAPELTLYGVTSISRATPEAEEGWRRAC